MNSNQSEIEKLLWIGDHYYYRGHDTSSSSSSSSSDPRCWECTNPQCRKAKTTIDPSLCICVECQFSLNPSLYDQTLGGQLTKVS